MVERKKGWYFGTFANRDIKIGLDIGYDDWHRSFDIYIDLPFLRLIAGWDSGGGRHET